MSALSRTYEALKAIAAISGIIAFASLAYTLYKDSKSRDREVAALQEVRDQIWREAEIFKVVKDSGLEGVTFSSIVQNVQAEWFESSESQGLTHSAAKDDQVLVGVVSLLSKNAISYHTDDRYRVPSILAGALSQDELFRRMNYLQEAALNRVVSEPRGHSMKSLQEWLQREYQATYLEAHRAVVPLALGMAGVPPSLIGPNPGSPPSMNDALGLREQ